MSPEKIIRLIRSQLAIIKGAGFEIISIDDLDKNLFALEQSATDFPNGLDEVIKERLAITREEMRLHKQHNADETLKLLQAATDSAFSALRVLLVLNGGGAIALLAFLGHLVTSSSFVSLIPGLAVSLLIFSAGLVFAFLAWGSVFFANLALYQGKKKNGQWMRGVSVFFSLGSLASFIIAVIKAFCTIVPVGLG